MARKKKNELPSGNIRIQKYDYTDESGKRHYKSFTAPTRAEAEFLAAQWKIGRADPKKPSLTVSEAAERYIEFKRAVLSPSTLRGYVSLKSQCLDKIGTVTLPDLDTPTVQRWVSDLSAGHSPKYVRNAYGLFSAALDMFAPEQKAALRVTLPAKIKPELYCPSDQDIKKLLKEVSGDPDLELAVLLAAFGPLRRGEICALEGSDLRGNVVRVSKSLVKGDDGLLHIKQPKTYGSYRDVPLPPYIADKMRGIDGRIVKLSPSVVSQRFDRALLRCGLPHFRFHDLRHYAASIMHAIGVPDQYILERGGWSSDYVMKSVYRNSISSESVRQAAKINEHFRLLSGEMS